MTGILIWAGLILLLTVAGLFLARRWLDHERDYHEDMDDDDYYRNLPP